MSDNADPTVASDAHPALTWVRRLGVAGFLFFLIKGLAWLIVPSVLAWWAVG